MVVTTPRGYGYLSPGADPGVPAAVCANVPVWREAIDRRLCRLGWVSVVVDALWWMRRRLVIIAN